ncbi:olfactory receptor 2F1-like [Erpetoichthys calabaricus]|uniref:olfactory receptor 2F1-like n=1 Tax=Erpetoichthys calabaricus TaxID=27687 RepID=UPI002234ACB5|nr:olfactory receptor 2F1-like [Erpetoichthys calabaricus]
MLILEGFIIPSEIRVSVFILCLAVYAVILTGNLTLLFAISFNQQLHKPMYMFLSNMIICDLIGSTALMPRLMYGVMTEDKLISIHACVIQAFCIHSYGSATQLMLTVMAIDRYFAICNPLRYHAIMTKWTIVKLSLLAWGVAFVLIFILLFLTLRLPRCKFLIVHAYCFNGSLYLLSCVDTTVNSIYGLFVTYFLTTVSFSTIAFTYTKILITCLFKAENNSKNKAIHTCSTHLTVYSLFEITAIFSTIAVRLPNFSPNAIKAMGTLMVILPPVANPIIYGLSTKEIRNIFMKHVKNRISNQ